MSYTAKGDDGNIGPVAGPKSMSSIELAHTVSTLLPSCVEYILVLIIV